MLPCVRHNQGYNCRGHTTVESPKVPIYESTSNNTASILTKHYTSKPKMLKQSTLVAVTDVTTKETCFIYLFFLFIYLFNDTTIVTVSEKAKYKLKR